MADAPRLKVVSHDEPAATGPSSLVPPQTRPTLKSRLQATRLRIAAHELPVQAVTEYSVGYSKQVIWSIIAAAKKWQEDDASGMAAGVAYYLALFPVPNAAAVDCRTWTGVSVYQLRPRC